MLHNCHSCCVSRFRNSETLRNVFLFIFPLFSAKDFAIAITFKPGRFENTLALFALSTEISVKHEISGKSVGEHGGFYNLNKTLSARS